MVRKLLSFSISNLVEARFRKFFLVGIFSTGLDFALFFLGYNILGWAVVPTNIISYGSAVTFGFFIHRVYTFRDGRKKSKRRLVLSLIFGYTGLAFNTAVVWSLSLVLSAWIGKVIAVFVVLFYNYLVNKYIVFAAH